SISRRGTTTTSKPGASLLRRKTSRINRLARFLWTAPPSFFVAAIPRRLGPAPRFSRKIVLKRPRIRYPRSYISWNSARRRTRSAGRKVARGGTRLLGADGQAFPALRPPAFEHQPAVLGAHPNQEAVRPHAAAAVRLKRSFPFHVDSDG